MLRIKNDENIFLANIKNRNKHYPFETLLDIENNIYHLLGLKEY